MGHNRLGRLPRTQKWNEVIELLHETPEEASRVAAAVIKATDFRFRQLADDPSLGYTFWLLARTTWAARQPDFIGELNRLGIDATDSSSALDIIAAIGDRVRTESANYPWTGHFGEFAALALRTALSSTVTTQGPSLFGSRTEDVQRAFRTYSTEARFGELARRFLSSFMSRSLQALVDRELANEVGTGTGSAGRTQFLDALHTHTWETSRIVERFAGEWYSKNNWETSGDIDPPQAQRFIAYGLRKLRSELKRGAETP